MTGQTKRFSIDRNGRQERTVVGKDGQAHTYNDSKRGSDGHFTDESEYRRAIEKAVNENSR